MADPVPVLPDQPRETEYNPVVATTGPFDVGFAVYGSGIDYSAWLEVYHNGALLVPVTQWTLSAPLGITAARARPITDARVTLVTAATGEILIVGRERPRRLTQLTENQGVPARDVNKFVSEGMAIARELYDRLDRALQHPPGDGDFDADDRQIGNLANGTASDDAATVAQVAAVSAAVTAAVTLLQSTMPLTVPVFASRTAVALATISATVKSLSTRGYTTEGDGGDWPVAIRVAAAPAVTQIGVRSVDRFMPDGSTDLVNGGWWQLVVSREIHVKQAGAKVDGVTDDTAAVNACGTALSPHGGEIVFPLGRCICAGSLNFDGRRSITLRGQNGLSTGSQQASMLVYSGAGTRFLDLRSTQGCRLEDLAVVYTNASFAGVLVDLSHGASAADAHYWAVERCYLSPEGSHKTAFLINLDKAILGVLRDLFLGGGAPAIGGQTLGGGSYANDILVENVTFLDHNGPAITGGGWNWTFVNVTWEHDKNGNINCFVTNAAAPVKGMTFVGCSTDDSNNPGGTTGFTFYGTDISFIGGRYSGHSASNFISLNSVTGFFAAGLLLDTFGVAFDFSTATCSEIVVTPSCSYANVSARYLNTANLGGEYSLAGLGAGRMLLQDGVAAPATIAGTAQLYVDSSDGDLKMKFGDGTVKTIVTDT